MGRPTSGGILNNRILFDNSRLLFSGKFCGGGQGCDGGRQSRDRGILTVPPLGKNLYHAQNKMLDQTVFMLLSEARNIRTTQQDELVFCFQVLAK